MGFTERLDSEQLLGRDAVGYAPALNPIGGITHLLSDSRDVWIPYGLTIDKRPGVVANGNQMSANYTAVWGTTSEAGTIAVSFLHTPSSRYSVLYRKSGGNWTLVTDLRNVQTSLTPHEMVWVRDKLYIRGQPGSGQDKIGAIIYNESDDSVDLWGVERSEDAPAFTSSAGWNSSGSDTVAPVAGGARYCYTYVSTTGHESSRSPFSDLSGNVASKYPAMTVEGLADTTNIPSINIYRSGDGGGGMFFIEQITNTGAGAINYEDTNFEPGGNFATNLDVTRPAPTRTSNEPPPTVETGVLGTDPVQQSAPIAIYGGRIYMPVGRNLYFTALDERVPNSGNPEECWRLDNTPSANKISFQGVVVDTLATRGGLLVWTARDTYIITGTNRSEIRARVLYPEVGARSRHCSTSFGDVVAWLDQDGQLRLATNTGNPAVVSGPLDDAQVIASRRYQVRYIKRRHYDWILVSVIDDTTPTNTKVFVYDPNRQLWFPPWSITTRTILEFGIVMGATTAVGQLTLSSAADHGSGFDGVIAFSLKNPPAGNQLNLRRVESTDSVLAYAEIQWKGSDTPTVSVRKSSLSTSTSTTRSDSLTSSTPIGYSRGFFYLGEPSDRFGLLLTLPSSSNTFQLIGAGLVFEPEMGD